MYSMEVSAAVIYFTQNVIFFHASSTSMHNNPAASQLGSWFQRFERGLPPRPQGYLCTWMWDTITPKLVPACAAWNNQNCLLFW